MGAALRRAAGASPRGDVLSRRALAERYGLPEAYLAKHLRGLVAVGILHSTSGPKGGYRLAKPAAQITALDVLDAVEGAAYAFRTRNPPAGHRRVAATTVHPAVRHRRGDGASPPGLAPVAARRHPHRTPARYPRPCGKRSGPNSAHQRPPRHRHDRREAGTSWARQRSRADFQPMIPDPGTRPGGPGQLLTVSSPPAYEAGHMANWIWSLDDDQAPAPGAAPAGRVPRLGARPVDRTREPRPKQLPPGPGHLGPGAARKFAPSHLG